MLNKNERMEALKNSGVDTSKYFTLNVNEAIPAGAKIRVVTDENGVAQIVMEKENDPIVESIIEDGYVRNSKLHRRWIMAQMFQFLNYVSYDKTESGFHACLRRNYPFHYTFQMMLEEVRVLSKLEARDVETFRERSSFFTKEVIVDVMKDYMDKLKEYVNTLAVHKCKGVPYKRIKGQNIFVEDIEKKVYYPLVGRILKVQYAKTYGSIYYALRDFVNAMVKLPYATDKSKVWIDTFKGEGAYYTLRNLIMFHACALVTPEGNETYGKEAVLHLNLLRVRYAGEGWRMFALMKKVIEVNHFDFSAKMHEIYSK